MKRLPSNWPLQLVKVTGSVIPPLDFNLFGPEGLLHKKIERLSCLSRQNYRKFIPFVLFYTFSDLRDYMTKKGLLEFPLRTFQTL